MGEESDCSWRLQYTTAVTPHSRENTAQQRKHSTAKSAKLAGCGEKSRVRLEDGDDLDNPCAPI